MGVRSHLAVRRVGSLVAVAGLVWLVGASAALAGNNGTLKIHELGTPDGTPNNDPKVCVFNVEAFGLDPGQGGYLQFTVQGGDDPQGTDSPIFSVPAANADGYFATEYFGAPAGHYKATLYGKGDLTDVKAKSKVFKVTCSGNGWGEGGGPGG